MLEFESCDKCKWSNKSPEEEPCIGCIHNATDKFKPKTTADYIRAMSDGELAHFLTDFKDNFDGSVYDWLKGVAP